MRNFRRGTRAREVAWGTNFLETRSVFFFNFQYFKCLLVTCKTVKLPRGGWWARFSIGEYWGDRNKERLKAYFFVSYDLPRTGTYFFVKMTLWLYQGAEIFKKCWLTCQFRKIYMTAIVKDKLKMLWRESALQNVNVSCRHPLHTQDIPGSINCLVPVCDP